MRALAFSATRTYSTVIGMCLGILSLSVNAETAIERGKAASAVCVACHQADGNGKHAEGGTAWPRLAGLDPVYLAEQLRAFKSGNRTNAEMLPFANMLNDQQIDDVSAYYASLPAKGPEQSELEVEGAEKLLEAGKKLALEGEWERYIVSCVSCHGPENQGIGHDFPDIAGQHAGYLANQLRAWQDGSRKGDPQGLMQAIALRMTDADIDAVTAWLSTQPPANGRVEGPRTVLDVE